MRADLVYKMRAEKRKRELAQSSYSELEQIVKNRRSVSLHQKPAAKKESTQMLQFILQQTENAVKEEVEREEIEDGISEGEERLRHPMVGSQIIQPQIRHRTSQSQ